MVVITLSLITRRKIIMKLLNFHLSFHAVLNFASKLLLLFFKLDEMKDTLKYGKTTTTKKKTSEKRKQMKKIESRKKKNDLMRMITGIFTITDIQR